MLKREYFILAAILFFSLLLNIIHNRYQLSGDERASLSSAAGAGITANRFQGKTSFRYTQAAPLEKNIFTQYDYSQKNTVKNVASSTVNFDSGNMIAYHLMLHGWFKIFRISVFNARFLSALFGMLTVLFTFLMVKKLTENTSIAFMACIILSIHSLLLHHAHMARGYAASLCFSTAASYVVLRISEEGISAGTRTLRYIIFALLAACAILSHYLSVAVFIYFAFWIITHKKFFRQDLLAACLAFIITSTIIFIWLQQGGFDGMKEMKKIDEWYLKNVSEQVRTSPRSLVEGTVQQLLAIFGNYGQYLGFRLRSIAFLLIFPVGSVLIGFNHFNNLSRGNALKFLAGPVIVVILFSAMLAIKSGHTTSFNARYGIYAIPFACALLAVSLHALTSGSAVRMKAYAVLAFTVTFLVFIFSAIPAYTGIAATYHSNPELHKDILNFNLNKYWLPDYYEPAARKIESSYTEGDTVIYNDWNTAQVVNLFLHNSPAAIVQKVNPVSKEKILFFEKASNSYKVISEAEK